MPAVPIAATPERASRKSAHVLANPAVYLALLLVLAGSAVADSFRAPNRQLTADLYLRSVGWYQYAISPRLGSRIRCRFRPTCSTYSLQAVKQFGIVRGLQLTASRLWRCRTTVSLGTFDPVPDGP